MTARRVQRRKKYLIAIGFQLKYVAYILVFLYIGALIAGYTVYYTTWVTLGEKLANVYPIGRLMHIFNASNITLLVRLLLITPLFILIGLLLSHRIAGPVYSIGRYIDMLLQGDYSESLTLRKKDELKELADKMNRLRNKLREDVEKRNEVISGLTESLQRQNASPEILEEVKTRLKEL